MKDINVRFRAAALGKSLENLANEVQDELNKAIEETANAAYSSILIDAQSKLNSSRHDYIRGLTINKIGENSHIITLEGAFPNALEEGYSGFDMRSKMLASEHVVGVGSRAGQPWVQQGAQGQKFAHVPFERRPYSKEAKSADLNQAIRKLTARNLSGRDQRFTSIFKTAAGDPLSGRVASVKKVKGFPELEGITKYQKVYKNESTGKQTVQSVYMTFRTISEHGPSWRHPGFEGIHAFDEAEKWVEQQIDNIINALIK